MSEPVCFISHFRVKDGKLDALKQLSRDVAQRLGEQKPRTAMFLCYVDEGRGVASFVHAFADAESMDLHIEGAGDRSRAAYEFMEPAGWEVYGRPSEAALGVLRQAASSSGVTLRVEPQFVSGFLRMSSG
jgi:hypothetical protein